MGQDDSRSARYRRVTRARDADLPALAIVRARRFLARYPTYGPAWYGLGIELIDLARYEEAEQAMAKALEFCPPEKSRIPLSGMGHVFNASGGFEQAMAWYQRAIEAAPDDSDSYIHMGICLLKQGRLAEAEEYLRRATQCSVGCIDEAYLNLGLVLRALGRYAEAAECFREAIRRDPDYRIAKKALRDVTACIEELSR